MIIGLTGGIGSGKTTVGEIFKHLKIPVFVADEEAKKLLRTSESLKQKLSDLLGPDLIREGEVDKAYMARRIFSDEKLLKKANAIIHPAVADAFALWHAKQNAPYVIREAAILFESGSHVDCDKIVVVTAPEDMRIQRVMQRSGESKEQIEQRMSRQWPQEKKEQLADFIIKNDHTEPVIPQVLKIHENIIRFTNQKS